MVKLNYTFCNNDRSCPLSLSGWNKRVDYEPGTGSKQLFPKMHLETCGGPLSSVRTTVELQTSHIGKGCDRETYSEKSLQKLCGEPPLSPSLHLPAPPSSLPTAPSLLLRRVTTVHFPHHDTRCPFICLFPRSHRGPRP